MKIAVITDSIDDGSAGVGTYARGLATALPDVCPEAVTFVHRRANEFYSGKRELVFPGWGSKFLRKQIMLPRALDHAGFDLVHETFHFPPFFGKTPFRKVMTIHDMTPFVLPRRSMALRNWLWHRLLVPPLARRADHVLTDSDHSRDDIIRVLGLAPERVSVAHLAAEASYAPRAAAEIDDVRARYNLPERFLLFVGAIEPRKNLVRLVHAYEQAVPRIGDVELVIAGGLAWCYAPVLRAIEQSSARERIRLLGRVPQQDLPALYCAALGFVYPSVYEGFGLPPLEAMQSGCPVITSNVSSLPEVVGDAALLVDPRDERALSRAIERMCNDAELRRELAEKGVRRAQRFTWRACAEATAAAYQQALAA